MSSGRGRRAAALYRAILRLAPRDAFEGLEAEMAAAFVEACAASYRDAGAPGLMRACAAGFADALAQVVREWRDRGRPPDAGGSGAWRRDAVQAYRAARGRPGYAIAVIATLAVVIGANTAVFSVLENVLLAPFPYEAQDRLVLVHRSYPGFDIARGPISYLDFADWRAGETGLEDLAAYSEEDFTYRGVEGAERWFGVEVTTNLMPLLGIRPILGRMPAETPDGLGPADEIVLSHDAWVRSFGSDPDIIGTTASLGGTQRTVIGVMPRGFRFPVDGVDFWTALPNHPYVSTRTTGFLTAIGRRSAGIGEASVSRRLAALSARIDETAGREGMEMGVYVESLRQAVVGDVRSLFLIAMGAVLAVFAIACANLTNLSLARGVARSREFAVRTALGAGRGAIGRQLTLESLALALIGGVAGAGLAIGLTRAFVGLAPPGVPRLDEIQVNVAALGFTLLISLVGGVVIGVAPARGAMRADPAGALRGAGRATTGLRGRKLQKGLVVAQVALTAVLLAGATLLLVSFERLSSIDPGIRHENILALRVVLEDARYEEPATAMAFHDELIRQVRALPGVRDAAISSNAPFTGTRHQLEIAVEGRDTEAGRAPSAQMAMTDAGYLSILGLELRAGRGFDPDSRQGEPRDALISETMSRVYWPGESPIGRRFSSGPADDKTWATVIGVVADNRHLGLEEEPAPMFFLDRHQTPGLRDAFLLVEGIGPVLSLTPALREVIGGLDAAVPVSEVASISSLIAETLTGPRFRTTVLAGLAVMALTIAAVGVYAVLAFLVGQRRREIGVRLALGAPRNSVFLRVAGEGTALVVLGLALGTVAAVALSGVVETMLYGVSARDPLTLALSSAFLLAVGFLACAGPALRASRVDPHRTLRE